MLIKEVHVKNFRSILDASLQCESLTALLGRNGSGKSSFLSALDFFYNPSARVTPEDFYSEDVTQDIEIAVTYSGLTMEAKTLFLSYIDNDNLTIVRVFSNPQSSKSGTYHGMRHQNPEFIDVRNAGGARDIRSKYNEIRQTEKYTLLSPVGSVDAVRTELAEWEKQNPEQCLPLRDDGQFFGFTEVAQGYLGRHTQFVLVPAVRDARDDATEGRGSPVTEVMNLVVRSVIENRKDLADFKQLAQEQYRKIMDPQKLTELSNLERDMSNTLKVYVPDANVRLQWSEFADISIPMPQVQVRLLEDEYETKVERTGHGLQRAFIVTMLQHLVSVRRAETAPADEASAEDSEVEPIERQLPSLVLAIEEPELYQHPSRQRHLASVLLKLASESIPGVAKATQVIYATHSPLFAGLDRFDQIRVLRKGSHKDGKPKITRLRKADMENVADELWEAAGRQGEQFTPETLRPRLQAIMTPLMGEGFFADVVVLVEGEDDRAAILGMANLMNHGFDSLGIAVIPCFGKTSLDRPLVIFRQLGLPVYVVWDGDQGINEAKPEDNRYLLRLLGQTEQDWPHFIGASCACFKVNLEETLADEIGKEFFTKWLSEAQQKFGIAKKKHALKNPAVFQYVVDKAASSSKTSRSLESIVSNVVALKNQP